MVKAATTTSDVLLAFAVEVVGLGAVAFVANSSDQAGTAMVTVMIGLWLLWMIGHTTQMQAIPNLFAALTTQGLA
jgi:hypothetical protein